MQGCVVGSKSHAPSTQPPGCAAGAAAMRSKLHGHSSGQVQQPGTRASSSQPAHDCSSQPAHDCSIRLRSSSPPPAAPQTSGWRSPTGGPPQPAGGATPEGRAVVQQCEAQKLYSSACCALLAGHCRSHHCRAYHSMLSPYQPTSPSASTCRNGTSAARALKCSAFSPRRWRLDWPTL